MFLHRPLPLLSQRPVRMFLCSVGVHVLVDMRVWAELKHKNSCVQFKAIRATEETLPFVRCVTAAGLRTRVALGFVQQIMKQVTKVVIHFLSAVEFLRKLSRPHWGTGSDVRVQRTKPASYFKLLVFRKAQQFTEAS